LSELKREKIWDPVTRVWHWVLVLCVGVSWGFGKFMSFDNVTWHFYLGYTILGLLAFRVAWGFIGPQPIRLLTLWPRPAAIITYLRTFPHPVPSGTRGHSPLGSLWILAILFLLIAQGFTGLFIDADDFFEEGPLYGSVSESTAKLFNLWHYYMSNVILGMVVLHVSVIIFYFVWKRENLVKPMVSGWKWVRLKKQKP